MQMRGICAMQMRGICATIRARLLLGKIRLDSGFEHTFDLTRALSTLHSGIGQHSARSGIEQHSAHSGIEHT